MFFDVFGQRGGLYTERAPHRRNLHREGPTQREREREKERERERERESWLVVLSRPCCPNTRGKMAG